MNDSQAERPVPVKLIQSVIWRRLDSTSLEHGRLLSMSDGFVMDGRVITFADGTPIEVHYAVHCDLDWITRFAGVSVVRGAATAKIEVRRDDQGRWWIDNRQQPQLAGIFDVDIAATPATNTLPIRRMLLQVGESRSTDAAWIRVPDLTCERLSQQYTRTDDLRYHYESRAGAFAADLDVDADGLVVRYGDIWERAAG